MARGNVGGWCTKALAAGRRAGLKCGLLVRACDVCVWVVCVWVVCVWGVYPADSAADLHPAGPAAPGAACAAAAARPQQPVAAHADEAVE